MSKDRFTVARNRPHPGARWHFDLLDHRCDPADPVRLPTAIARYEDEFVAVAHAAVLSLHATEVAAMVADLSKREAF